MKNLVWGLGILLCLVAGCVKSNNNNATCSFPDSPLVAPSNEIDTIKLYLNLHSLTATQHPAGFFYTINTQGTGQPIANLCSTVAIKYTGRLSNGKVFDSTGNSLAIFQVGQFIPGWQKGLPLISKGGKITLYVPPTLGYGNTDVTNGSGVVIIPKNSMLIFDIELVDIG